MKTKQFIAAFLAVIYLLGMNCFALADRVFAGGNGTEEDPFLIETAEQFQFIQTDPDAHYKLTADLTLPEDWSPIGTDETVPFKGTFDGDGHTLRGLKIEKSDSSTYYAGVFGCNEGTIRNLTVREGLLTVNTVDNDAEIYIGGIVGFNKGTVQNCQSFVTLNATGVGSYVGGIAGYNLGTVADCMNNGAVEAQRNAGGIVGRNLGTVECSFNLATVNAMYAGGIAGYNEGGTIQNSFNTGTLAGSCVGGITGGTRGGVLESCYNTATYEAAWQGGGIAAECRENSQVENCYNTGAAIGSGWNMGGLVGYLLDSEMENSYNVGEVGDKAGGLIGLYESGTVSGCYYLNTAVKGVASALFYGDETAGTSVSREELLLDGTCSEFDFDEVWEMGSAVSYEYPTLRENGWFEFQSIELAASPQKTEYMVGSQEPLDLTGAVLQAVYSHGYAEEVPLSGEMVSGFDTAVLGPVELTVAYQEKTTTFFISVVSVLLDRITVTTLPDCLTYLEKKDELDVTGGIVTLYYSDGNTADIPMSHCTVTGFSNRIPREQELTVTYRGKTAAFTVTVVEREVVGVEIVTMPEKTVYLAGEPFDPAGMTVQASFNNGENILVTDYTVDVNTAEVGEQTLTVNYRGTSAMVSVTVRPAFSFTDVEKDWAYEGIDYCYRHEILMGTGETTFSPKMGMSRAMVVTALYRLSGSPEGAASAGFDDVPQGMWYTEAIDWAAEAGIIGGVGGNLCAPDREITRAEFAIMLYRYAELNGKDVSNDGDLSSFMDEMEVAEWAVVELQWAVSASLIGGTEVDGEMMLMPTALATREQGATLLMRYLKYLA